MVFSSVIQLFYVRIFFLKQIFLNTVSDLVKRVDLPFRRAVNVFHS